VAGDDFVLVAMIEPEVMVDELLDELDELVVEMSSFKKIQNSLIVEFQKQYHGLSPMLSHMGSSHVLRCGRDSGIERFSSLGRLSASSGTVNKLA
jgi:hypothetical protein